MRILVIGGTRFIGRAVVERLLQMGHEVAVFHRGETNADFSREIKHIHGDRHQLASYKEQFKQYGPQVVLDMFPMTEKDAIEVMNLFRGMTERVVAISSLDVYLAYGKLIEIEEGPIQHTPFDEEAPLRQRFYPYRHQMKKGDRLYDYDKILVERVVMGDDELPGTILRLPFVIGPHDQQHRLYPYLKRMIDQRPAILLSKGLSTWRSSRGYVENVAHAISLAVTDHRAKNRIYNVADREAFTEFEWVNKIKDVMNWSGEIVIVADEEYPPGFNPAQDMVADTNRIREEIGYKEIISPEESLRRTIEWELKSPPITHLQLDYETEDLILSRLR